MDLIFPEFPCLSNSVTLQGIFKLQADVLCDTSWSRRRLLTTYLTTLLGIRRFLCEMPPARIFYVNSEEKMLWKAANSQFYHVLKFRTNFQQYFSVRISEKSWLEIHSFWLSNKGCKTAIAAVPCECKHMQLTGGRTAECQACFKILDYKGEEQAEQTVVNVRVAHCQRMF